MPSRSPTSRTPAPERASARARLPPVRGPSGLTLVLNEERREDRRGCPPSDRCRPGYAPGSEGGSRRREGIQGCHDTGGGCAPPFGLGAGGGSASNGTADLRGYEQESYRRRGALTMKPVKA